MFIILFYFMSPAPLYLMQNHILQVLNTNLQYMKTNASELVTQCDASRFFLSFFLNLLNPQTFILGVYWNRPAGWLVGWTGGRADKKYCVFNSSSFNPIHLPLGINVNQELQICKTHCSRWSVRSLRSYGPWTWKICGKVQTSES